MNTKHRRNLLAKGKLKSYVNEVCMELSIILAASSLVSMCFSPFPKESVYKANGLIPKIRESGDEATS